MHTCLATVILVSLVEAIVCSPVRYMVPPPPNSIYKADSLHEKQPPLLHNSDVVKGEYIPMLKSPREVHVSGNIQSDKLENQLKNTAAVKTKRVSEPQLQPYINTKNHLIVTVNRSFEGFQPAVQHPRERTFSGNNRKYAGWEDGILESKSRTLLADCGNHPDLCSELIQYLENRRH